ncbi:C39 family peptidase [Paraburkholderia bannensis]|uniref:C39 family peptidase n=1 Tax=Paraburkholderia bannensis TaxID=765414 RepID=UPI002AB5E58D|nr:C39 family peptidase [Paraburkholderia bannensis]
MQASREQVTGQRRALAQEKEIRHFGVPYYSQWGSPEWVERIVMDDVDPCDDPAWRASGFAQPEQYRFWAKRLCGLTCFESALDYWGIEHAPRAAMLEEALKHGVYRMREDGGVDGMIYAPFAAWAESAYGVRVEVMTDETIQASAARLSADTLAIVSVSPEIRYPQHPNDSQGGHLILLHGRSDGGVWFHNPSGVKPYQADAWLPYDTVARFHARRGMALTRIVDDNLADD